jgi:hypothetical protein
MRDVDQRPGVGLLIVGQFILHLHTPYSILHVCYYSKVRPFGCAPGLLDFLNNVASPLPDKGAGLLSISVT